MARIAGVDLPISSVLDPLLPVTFLTNTALTVTRK
jgi:uncharacterized protein YceK